MPTPSEAPKRLRSQLTDPLTGKRVSVYADDPQALEYRASRIRTIRDDLNAGVITREAAEQTLRPYVSGPLTMGMAFKRYLVTVPEASKRLASTNWKNRLEKWFGDLPPEALIRERLAAWESEMIQLGFSSATIRNSYNHLAGCCRMLIDSKEIKDLPWGSISKFAGGSGWRPQKGQAKKRRQAVVTVQAMVAMIEVARAEDEERWLKKKYSDWSIILGVLFLTGMRQAEAAALSWDSVSLDQAVPILRVQWQGKRAWNTRHPEWTRPMDPTKTRRELVQHLHPLAVQMLRAQRAELVRRGWYAPDGPVFPGRGGVWRTHGDVLKPELIRRFAKRAGFPQWQDWVTHSTRHSFATLEVIGAGGDLKRAQRRTGHADVRALEGYLHTAGPLLAESGIPVFEMAVEPVVARLPGDVEVVAADPWGIDQVPKAGDLVRVDYEAQREWARVRAEQKAEARAEVDASFAELALNWLRLRPSERGRRTMPDGVAIKAKQAASRNYNRVLRDTNDRDKARRSAARGRIAVKAAWSKALKAARKSV